MKNYEEFYNKLRTFKDTEAIIENDNVYTYNDVLNKILFFEKLLINEKVPCNSLISIYGNMSFNSICMFLCLSKNSHTIIPISEVSKNKKTEFLEISSADYIVSFTKGEVKLEKTNSVKEKHEYYKSLKRKNSSSMRRKMN